MEGASACGSLAKADLANPHATRELQDLAPQARVVLRLFNTSLADAVRSLVGEDVTVLPSTELAAPAFSALPVELRTSCRHTSGAEGGSLEAQGSASLFLAMAGRRRPAITLLDPLRLDPL